MMDEIFYDAYRKAVKTNPKLAKTFMHNFFNALRQMDKHVGGKLKTYDVWYYVDEEDGYYDKTVELVARNKYHLMLKLYKHLKTNGDLETSGIFSPQSIIEEEHYHGDADEANKYYQSHCAIRNEFMRGVVSDFYYTMENNDNVCGWN